MRMDKMKSGISLLLSGSISSVIPVPAILPPQSGDCRPASNGLPQQAHYSGVLPTRQLSCVHPSVFCIIDGKRYSLTELFFPAGDARNTRSPAASRPQEDYAAPVAGHTVRAARQAVQQATDRGRDTPLPESRTPWHGGTGRENRPPDTASSDSRRISAQYPPLADIFL